MTIDRKIERDAFVYCNWLVLGLIGSGLIFEGGARDNVLVGCVGVLAIASGFVGHIIINHIFACSFSRGEAALGLGLFALTGVVFISSWLTGELSSQDVLIGLALCSVVVIGFIVYVTTRYGAGGAFRKFDVVPNATSGHRK